MPHVFGGISNAAARFGENASLDHMTCVGANVSVSQVRPSSRKFRSPGTAVLKSKAGAFVTLSTTHTWLHPSEPSNSRLPPIATPLLKQPVPAQGMSRIGTPVVVC